MTKRGILLIEKSFFIVAAILLELFLMMKFTEIFNWNFNEYYLIGIAIGFTIIGFIVRRKRVNMNDN